MLALTAGGNVLFLGECCILAKEKRASILTLDQGLAGNVASGGEPATGTADVIEVLADCRAKAIK
jgi:hypothetical protein